MKNNIFVFDVESTSLFGNGFAVGVIVLDKNKKEVDRFELLSKEGELFCDNWVKENILPSLKNMPFCNTDRELRDAFYDFYMKHKKTAEIWSDCNFPVETNFLNDVAKDDLMLREFNMPYPLMDISTVVNINIDRFKECKLNGLIKHHPLHDALSSAYCLLDYKKNGSL